MIRFIHIAPLAPEGMFSFEAADFEEAKQRAGLDRVDFGALASDLSICVDDEGFQMELGRGYFAIGRHLFAGNALIFGVDSGGETASTTSDDSRQISEHIRFFANKLDAINDIEAGRSERPQTSINGEVVWEWE